MFSKRLPWRHADNALARVAAARRSAGLPLIDLTGSNPTEVGLSYPTAEILAALAVPGVARYEPVSAGLRLAREAVAADYARRGAAVSPDAIVLTASSSESYGFLLKLLCDPGDAVLVPVPSYPLFEYLGRLEGVRLRPYRLALDGAWRIDFESLAAAADGRARAVIAVAPNNPTGSSLALAELERLGDFCAERGCALVVDEVFADYASADDRLPPVAALALRALTFSLGGLSKSCGLPQLKLGWIAVSGPARAAGAALAGLELIADTYLSVAAPVQGALPRLFELGAGIRRQLRERIAVNRAALGPAIPTRSPVSPLPAEGAWSALLRLPATRTDEEWALALLEHDGVLVHPGYLFDMPGGAYLVLSVLPEPSAFAEGLRRICARGGSDPVDLKTASRRGRRGLAGGYTGGGLSA